MKATRNEDFVLVEFSEQELVELGSTINLMDKIGETREGKGVYLVSKQTFITLILDNGFGVTFTPNTSKTEKDTAKEIDTSR